ncbi:hypothetical protein [Vibrio sp. CyArs1]|uniref:hypothetical protein n=1 Tax=Vibrio sp. CyArs1 TaxID=2682577 RepID=UPI001F06A897|nr:hypothetical protein [Vibrio sp. CyArs1]
MPRIEPTEEQLNECLITPLKNFQSIDGEAGRGFISELSKCIVKSVFRDSPLEDLHAGFSIDETETEQDISKITDEEMKHLMVHTTNHLAKLLEDILNDPESLYLFLHGYTNEKSLRNKSKEEQRQVLERILKYNIKLAPSYWNEPDWELIDTERKKGDIKTQEIIAMVDDMSQKG